jgi:hypothetical protein
MRRSVIYMSLIAAAIVFGIVAAGVPSSRNDPVLHVSSSATTTSVPPALAPTTSPTVAVPAAHSPGAVSVLIANASGNIGAGATRATALGNAGYKTLRPVETVPSSQTAVYFLPGYQADASAVAALIGAPSAAVQPMPAKTPGTHLRNADVRVVIGPDLAHR